MVQVVAIRSTIIGKLGVIHRERRIFFSFLSSGMNTQMECPNVLKVGLVIERSKEKSHGDKATRNGGMKEARQNHGGPMRKWGEEAYNLMKQVTEKRIFVAVRMRPTLPGEQDNENFVRKFDPASGEIVCNSNNSLA